VRIGLHTQWKSLFQASAGGEFSTCENVVQQGETPFASINLQTSLREDRCRLPKSPRYDLRMAGPGEGEATPGVGYGIWRPWRLFLPLGPGHRRRQNLAVFRLPGAAIVTVLGGDRTRRFLAEGDPDPLGRSRSATIVRSPPI